MRRCPWSRPRVPTSAPCTPHERHLVLNGLISPHFLVPPRSAHSEDQSTAVQRARAGRLEAGTATVPRGQAVPPSSCAAVGGPPRTVRVRRMGGRGRERAAAGYRPLCRQLRAPHLPDVHHTAAGAALGVTVALVAVAAGAGQGAAAHGTCTLGALAAGHRLLVAPLRSSTRPPTRPSSPGSRTPGRPAGTTAQPGRPPTSRCGGAPRPVPPT